MGERLTGREANWERLSGREANWEMVTPPVALHSAALVYGTESVGRSDAMRSVRLFVCLLSSLYSPIVSTASPLAFPR